MKKRSQASLVESITPPLLVADTAIPRTPGPGLIAARLAEMYLGQVSAVSDQGHIIVDIDDSTSLHCDWLDTGTSGQLAIAPGDRVMVCCHRSAGRPVVVGRIGPYRAPPTVGDLTIESAKSLSLRCGDASLTLHADGKVMVKGEDILLRAKGTQRIRAGNVAIN